MWESDPDQKRTEAEWQAMLRDAVASPDSLSCARFIFQIASQAPEFYLGGNDSPFLLQVLSAPSESGEIDVITTILAPLEKEIGVHMCCTMRGEEALKACSLFMEAFPEAPALLQKSDESFDYILCSMSDEASWQRRPVTLKSLVHSLKSTTEADSLSFFLPAEASKPDGPPRISLERFETRPDELLD
jgi:hypothetical protein